MKTKYLFTLILIALILGAWAYKIARNREKTTPSVIGTRIFADLPINDISKIIITRADATVDLAKVKGKWSVLNRYNYPAKFGKVVKTITEVADLKIGQVITAPEADWGSFHLLSPKNIASNHTKEAGSLLELADKNGRILASLIIGKRFMRQPARQTPQMMAFGGYPDGQYLRTGSNLFLAAKNLDRLKEDIPTWLDDKFINVPESNIKKIGVTGTGREPIELIRSEEGKELQLRGIHENEKPDTSEINRMANALHYFSFDDVASPALSHEKMGLDKGTFFVAHTFKNQIYRVQIGKKISEENPSRYVKVNIEFNPPKQKETTETKAEALKIKDAEKEKNNEMTAEKTAKLTKSLNEKLSGWTYIVKSYRIEPLLTKREKLIKEEEKKKAK